MNKTIFLGLTIGVITVAMITSLTVREADFIVMAAWKKITSSVGCADPIGDGATTCCWTEENTDIGKSRKACQTCTSGGCETTYGDEYGRPNDPACRKFGVFEHCLLSQGPGYVQDKPNVTQGGPAWGGIFQGTITPMPGPATQDQPSTAQREPAAQDTPQSETSGPRQGGILGNWGLFKTSQNQNQETPSEEDVVAEPPATEETQPAIINEESIPHCPEGQVLDEESGLCVLKEPQGEEQPEEENQESENNGSEDGDAEEASD